MPAIKYVEIENASEEVKQLYEQIKQQFGVSEIPNTFKAMANNPKFLKTLLDMDKAVFSDAALDEKTKHLIAVAVSAASGCPYCTHAHTALAQLTGATEDEIAETMSVAAIMGAYNNFNKATGFSLDIKPQ